LENNKAPYNIYNAKKIIIEKGLKPKTIMGQNFLIDPNIPAKIVKESGIDKSCGVLEVGPGLGALTLELSKAANNVYAIELDYYLIPVLQEIFSGYDNVKIIQGDILNTDINKVIANTMSGLKKHVCANLPYNITTPAITTFIESQAFESITVMVQKEVALRMCATPGNPDYSAFTIYTNYHSNAKILFDVPPDCFTPRPKVTSSVIKMTLRSTRLLNEKDEKTFFAVVKAAFGQRRKTLANALFAGFANTHTKNEIIDIINDCGYDIRVRGEALSCDDFIKLSASFMK